MVASTELSSAPVGEQRVQAIVSGVVQGVGYRAATRKEALHLHVHGSAMNLADGTVEVILAGPTDAVARLCDWLKVGPCGAVVESVAVRTLPWCPMEGFVTGSKERPLTLEVGPF
jgi:acylphosphatase